MQSNLDNIVVQLSNISKSFSNKNRKALLVIDNLSISLKKGEIVSVVGKSGSGKTTLLNIISATEQPTEGEVIVRGTLGYAAQKDLLLPWRTVLENVLLPVEISRSLSKEKIQAAHELLTEVGLGSFIHAYPGEISGGMKQKAALVRTFIQNPDIFLFDEAFSAIDFDSRLKISRDVRKRIISEGKSAFFVTHNIEEAISVGDRVIVLSSLPARIIYQSEVHISENLRDPLEIRKLDLFQNLFEKIWKSMITQHEKL